MASPMSTFATLRALHLVIGDALDDIQRVFSQNILPEPPASPASQCSSPVYPNSPDPSPAASPFPTTPPTSFPPTPLSATFPSLHSSPHTNTSAPSLDYPSPDLPYVPDSPSEQLALHPDAVIAASRIVAACGQISNIVHKPFLSLCDAITSVCTLMLFRHSFALTSVLSGAYMRACIVHFICISTTSQHACALLNTFISRKSFGKLTKTDSVFLLVVGGPQFHFLVQR